MSITGQGPVGTGRFHNVGVLISFHNMGVLQSFPTLVVPFSLVLLNLPLCNETQMELGFQLWN